MIFAFDDFELDAERLELRRSGKLLKANRTVLMALACLLQNAGRLVTKDELVDEVWEGRAVADTVITVAMARLRKTLGQRRGDVELFENVYGRGYRFLRPVVERNPSTRPPPALVGEGIVEPPFVGRDRVLHRLGQALAQAHEGRGRLCALIGEAGIGKTHVAETFERGLQGKSTLVTWGFCPELEDTPPLSLWQRALRPVLALLEPGALEEKLGGLADELRALLEGSAAEGRRATSVEAPEHARGRVFEAIARAVALASRVTPIVIVLDDLHRADAASLELLARLVDELSHTRLLIVATVRPAAASAAPDPHLAYAIGHRNCERIVLEALAAEDVSRYVAAVLDDPDGALGRAVFDKSEGNPFFMVELSRQLADMEAPAADAVSVPDAALDLVRQRLARLDADSRSVLSAAAVVGRSFELGVLQRVTDSDPGAMIAQLDAAIGAEVLVAAPDSMTAFAFSHELLRVALYEALPPAERRRLHLRTAEALEQRLAGGEGVPASALAFHFHRALPDANPRKTVDYCRAAAASASVAFAAPDVARYMRHALEALDLMERPSARLRMSLLQTIVLHTRSSNPPEFQRAMGEIVRLATEQGDGASLAMAGAMMNPSLGFKPEPEAAQVHERALSLLPAQLAPLRATSLAGLAAAPPHCYDAAVVEEHLAEATRLCGDGTPAPIRHGVLLCRLYLHGGPAHDDEERALRRELDELAQKLPRVLPVLPAELALSRAVTALQRGEGAAATEAIERAITRYREIGQPEGLWYAERARVLQRRGHASDADVAAGLHALHARVDERNLPRTEPFRAFDRAVSLPALGQPVVPDEALRRSLAYDRSEPPSLWSMKVRALSAAGWVDAAYASLRAVSAEGLAKLPCDRDYLGTLGHLAEAALLLGADDYVAALRRLLEPYPDRTCVHVAFFPEGTVSEVLERLAAAG